MHHRRIDTIVGFMALGVALTAAPAGAAPREDRTVRIDVLSNRADLISGGDALVRVSVPDDADARTLTISLGGRTITGMFTAREPAHATGVVDGLVVGENLVEARLPDGRGARLTITNHPEGGPVFAGPQVQPWTCTTQINGLGAAVDDQCNAATQVSYLYQPKSARAGNYKPYDVAHPPRDVATTKTDAGVEVPYVVRLEKGTIDRAIYKVMVLADPARPWTSLAPQRAWNRKLFAAFGGGCGTPHRQAPPNQSTAAFSASAADGELQQPELLARGWMVTGSGMNTLNLNCNEVVSAEALMMIKEHIAETYGPIRRTVSIGGSGGSLQQLNIAASYPGLLDGIVPTQSFPDLWQLVGDSTECYLTTRYFLKSSPWLWLDPRQRQAVTGKSGPLACTEFVSLFGDAFDPQNRGPFQIGRSFRTGCALPVAQRYDPITNPTGARCSVQDYQAAIWGHSGPGNAAPLPYDNTGVQYGLSALQRRVITARQFVDLNTKIGGLDNEGNFTGQRSAMDLTTVTTMYRAGRTTDPRRLADVPIIDVRQAVVPSAPDRLSDLHQPYNSHMLRARLDAVNGTHANAPLWHVAQKNVDITAVLAVDRWLDAADRDTRDIPRAEKIIRDKPTDLVDTCWIGGRAVTDSATCDARYPYGSDPRIAAGAPLRGDVRKCQLKPLRREDYDVNFTADQWARLEGAFPDGVCNWSLPSVGYQPSIPWMSYADGPGGTPIGPPPVSTPSDHPVVGGGQT